MREAVLKGFSRYLTSESGIVKYKDTGKICPDYSAGKSPKHIGYRKIKITPDGSKKRKCFSVHKLVWLVFYGEIPDGFEVDHINRKRDDNRLDNLRIIPIVHNRRRKKAAVN